ncbi:MAG: cysteine-rich CWC family protein [Endozoicomonas sp.]
MTNESSLCPDCGRPNRCAITEGRPAVECWCMAPAKPAGNSAAKTAMKPLPVPEGPASCYCPECLASVKSAR